MTEDQSGDRRGRDRRSSDRRRTERRTPPPLWRRPVALVAYGVVGTLVLVGVLAGVGGNDDEPARTVEADAESEAPRADSPQTPAASGEDRVQPALTASDFERLTVEGGAARGRRIRVDLSCQSVISVATRSVEEPDEAIQRLEDDNGRVPGVQCRWGRRGEEQRRDFFLLVPSELANEFAGAPTMEDGFVTRRHVVAEVEWIGRSEMLSLRTVGILRRMVG